MNINISYHLYDGNSIMLNENHPKQPLNYYAETKNLSEDVIMPFIIAELKP